MERKVVEDVAEPEVVVDFQLVYVRIYFKNVVRAGSQESFWCRFNDRLEAVADDFKISDAVRVPIGEEKIVGDLLGAVRQVEDCGMLNRVLSFAVLGEDFVLKGLEELFLTAREYRIEKL